MSTLYKIVKCKCCEKEIQAIEMFPNDLCINCYEKTDESKVEYTDDLFIKSIKIK